MGCRVRTLFGIGDEKIDLVERILDAGAKSRRCLVEARTLLRCEELA